MTFERWVDRPGRDVRACVLLRPYEFRSPFGRESFVLLLVVCDEAVSRVERDSLCDAIVGSDCRYVCCAGRDCELWHDWLDETCVGNGSHPVFLMTTWHDRDSPAEVVHFLLEDTFDDHRAFERNLVAFVGYDPQLRREYEALVRRRSSGGGAV